MSNLLNSIVNSVLGFATLKQRFMDLTQYVSDIFPKTEVIYVTHEMPNTVKQVLYDLKHCLMFCFLGRKVFLPSKAQGRVEEL